MACQKFEGSVWRCLLIFFLQYISYLNNILGTIASHEMVESFKTAKERGLERIDEFISRFTDFEHPGRNKDKRASYYDSIKKEKVVSFQTVKKKTLVTVPPILEWNSLPFWRQKIEPSYDYGLACH